MEFSIAYRTLHDLTPFKHFLTKDENRESGSKPLEVKAMRKMRESPWLFLLGKINVNWRNPSFHNFKNRKMIIFPICYLFLLTFQERMNSRQFKL